MNDVKTGDLILSYIFKSKKFACIIGLLIFIPIFIFFIIILIGPTIFNVGYVCKSQYGYERIFTFYNNGVVKIETKYDNSVEIGSYLYSISDKEISINGFGLESIRIKSKFRLEYWNESYNSVGGIILFTSMIFLMAGDLIISLILYNKRKEKAAKVDEEESPFRQE